MRRLLIGLILLLLTGVGPLLVWGRLQIRSYESKEGEKKWSSEIKAENFQILPYKKDDEVQSKKTLISAEG